MQNIFRAGAQGWDDTGAMIDGLQRKRAGFRAAPKIAQGDYRGAAEEYGAMGQDREAAAMQGQVRADEQQQYERGREGQEDQRARAARSLDVLTRIAQGLQSVPPGQRKAALQRVYPIFEKLDLDTATFDGLQEEQLTDEALTMFAGEMEKQLQIVNRGGGGYDVVNTRTGEAVRSVEPDPKLQIIGQGAVAIDPETRQPVYRNPKTFAPKSGGGRSGGGLPPPPAGWTPAR